MTMSEGGAGAGRGGSNQVVGRLSTCDATQPSFFYLLVHVDCLPVAKIVKSHAYGGSSRGAPAFIGDPMGFEWDISEATST